MKDPDILIQTRVPISDADRLKVIATRMGLSQAALVRMIIREGVTGLRTASVYDRLGSLEHRVGALEIKT